MGKRLQARKTRQSPRKQPVLLSELIKTYRPAFLVYGVLRELAGDQRQYQCTRRTVTEKISMDPKTISKAMKALAQAGWIKLGYGTRPDKNRKWYRITFVSDEFIPSQGRRSVAALPAKTPRAKGRPETQQAGRRGKAAGRSNATSSFSTAETLQTDPRGEKVCPPNGSQGAAEDSTATSPWTHAEGPRDCGPAPSNGSKGGKLNVVNSPESLQTVPREESLDPSNGSKGSVPLDPRGGSYSLERVGGAPPAPPPSPPLSLGSGVPAGTPETIQRLKKRCSKDQSTLINTSERDKYVEGGVNQSGRAPSQKREVPDDIQRIIDRIRGDADPDLDDAGADRDTQMEQAADGGGG